MLDLPLEYALIKFEESRFSGKIVPEILDLAAARHRARCGYCFHTERAGWQHAYH